MKKYILYNIILRIGFIKIQEFLNYVIEFCCSPCLPSMLFVIIYAVEILMICTQKTEDRPSLKKRLRRLLYKHKVRLYTTNVVNSTVPTKSLRLKLHTPARY